jgi:hypothetical protein
MERCISSCVNGDADADERRQRAFAHALRELVRDDLRVMVFLLVGTIAVAVLEVDAEVLDRLAAELLADALPDRRGVDLRTMDRARKRERVDAVLFEDLHGLLASLRAVSLLKMRAAVDGMQAGSRRARRPSVKAQGFRGTTSGDSVA